MHDNTPRAAAVDSIADAFVRWSDALSWDALPATTRDMARCELLDLLGDAIAGRALMGSPDWLRAMTAGGAAQATAVGGDRLSAPDAALVNGYYGHVLELDDTHDEAVLHAGVSVLAAALAAAELRGGVTGKAFLEALVQGIEITCRLGVATRLNLVEGGWIYSSLLGHFGAAAAAARILSPGAATLRNALGIVYCFTSGNHQSTREGAPTKHLQPAIAGSNGVRAAIAAAGGLPGVVQPFEGEDGLGRVYLHGRLDAARAVAGLGSQHEVDRLSFKPYPSCRLTHAAISAALELHAALGDDVARIERVELAIGPQAHDVVGRTEPARLHPTAKVAAQFSVYWCVAVALAHGEVTPLHVFAEVPPSPAVAAMIARIACTADAPVQARDVGGCRLVAHGAFGTREVAMPSARGSPENPLSEADLVAKFARNVALAGWSADRADAAARLVLELDRAANLDGLVALVAASVPRKEI